MSVCTMGPRRSLRRRMVVSCLLFATSQVTPGVWARRVLLGNKQQPDMCDCKRCEGAKRTTTIGVCGAKHMCVPEPLYSEDNKFLCMVPTGSVLMEADRGKGVPKEKFCLQSCVPEQSPDLKMLVGSQCSDITAEQMVLVPDSDAGVDPACVIAHLESLDPDAEPIVEGAVNSGETAPAAGGGEKAKTEEAETPETTEAPTTAPMDDEDLKTLVANTIKGKATILSVRASRAAAQAEEAAANAKEKGRASKGAAAKNVAAVADLKSLLAQIKLYKQSAWRARETTKQLYANMQNLADKVATEAAAKAKAEVEEHIKEAADINARIDAYFAPESPAGEVTEQVGHAIAPYVDAKGHAAKVAGQYQAMAEHESARAFQMHDNAKTLLKQALDWQASGHPDFAQQYHEQAEKMFKAAQDLHAKAQQAENVAGQVRSNLPLYDQNIAHMSLYTTHNLGEQKNAPPSI